MFEHGFPPYWSTIKKLIWLVGTGIVGGVTEIWKTVTGTIIHITDALASPMQKCEVTLEPIQDLHGQDAPYPAGGGKNKINAPDVTLDVAGYIFNGAVNLPAGTYTINFSGAVNSASMAILDADGNAMVAGSHNVPYTFTLNADAVSARFYVASAGTYSQIQIEAGSTATAYAPYSNICPITGWTGCEVTRTGKNLCDASTLYRGGIDPSSGALTDTGVRVTSDYIPVSAGKTYYGSESSGNVFVAFHCYNKNKENAGSTNVTTNPYTIPEGVYYVRAMFRKEDGTASVLPSEIKKPQIEESTTATDYEPYSGTTLSVTFPDTVYGGSHEFVSGVGESKMASVDMSTLAWNMITQGNNVFWTAITGAPTDTGSGNIPDIYCSCFKKTTAKSSTAWGNTSEDMVVSLGYDSSRIYLRCSTCSTVADLLAILNGQTFVYPLATPTEISLTPQEISTLAGENNVWSNGDSVKITYKAQA